MCARTLAVAEIAVPGMSRRVLVLGGYGIYGRTITIALSKIPNIDSVIAGRRPHRAARLAERIGARIAAVDVTDSDRLNTVLDGVFAVVDASAPFQGRSYVVPQLCAERGVHYVDLADSRVYVTGISRLDRTARRTGSLLVSGAGMLPGVSSVLLDWLASGLDRLDEIHTAVTYGSRQARGAATSHALLSWAGAPLRVKERGRWRDSHGWSESEVVAFPSPVGRRRVYLCDAADLEIFPKRYRAETVATRVGFGRRRWNYFAALLGWLRRRGMIENAVALAPALRRIGDGLADRDGFAGGIFVSARGMIDGVPAEHAAFLISRDEQGLAVAVSPAVALIRRWLQQGTGSAGAMPCVGLLTLDELIAEMRSCDIRMVLV